MAHEQMTMVETNDEQPLAGRITRLVIHNYEGIEALELECGKVNVLKGHRGAGKSSVLDAISTLVANARPRPVVVRDGAERAVLLMETDDGLQVERTITADGRNKLSVEKGRAAFKAPQGILDALFGRPDVWMPAQFLTLNPKEQAAALLRLVDVTVTQDEYRRLSNGRLYPTVHYDEHPLTVLKQLEEALMQDRLLTNRDLKDSQASVRVTMEALVGFDAEAARGESIAEMVGALQQARRQNEDVAKRHAQRERLAQEIEGLKDELAALERQISGAKVRLAEHDQWLAETPTFDDDEMSAMEQSVAAYEETRAKVARYDDAQSKQERIEALQATSDTLTGLIEEVRLMPGRLLAASECPVEGLGVSEDGTVTVRGLPLANLSAGERIELSLAVAKARSGDIPLLLIDGFEALDPATQDEFMRRAEDDRWQYFVTLVTDGEFAVEVA